MRSEVIEALKEVGRLSVLAIIPLLIDGLSQGAIDWRLVGITAAIAALRFLDKLLHELGKTNGSEGLQKGLTGF